MIMVEIDDSSMNATDRVSQCAAQPIRKPTNQPSNQPTHTREATTWFKLNPTSLVGRGFTPFWEIDPECLHTCSMSPCRPIEGRCFNFHFFVMHFPLLLILEFWGLEKPQVPDKQENTHTPFVKASTGGWLTEHVTKKKQEPCLKNALKHLGSSSENVHICAGR